MVASATMTAAALSGVILGSFMCTLIVLCKKFDRDPDNIAPAVASCLGDLVTLILLGVVSTLLIPFIRTPIPFVVGGLVFCCAFICLLYTLKNRHIRPLLKEGWSPLFAAMAISSGTGIVLEMFVSRYEGFAILAIVISGLPGAAGSILVSRLSTSLHAAKLALERALPSFSSSSKHPEPSPLLSMITLLLITIPVEIIFLSILDVLGWLKLPILFTLFSIVFFCCAVSAEITSVDIC
jgi:solute carrier family 41